MRYILFLVLMLLGFPLQSQEAADPSTLIEINDMLHFYDFEQMRSFIIENGDRKTYCPNYKNNPHYVMADDNLEIYMNPVVKGGAMPKVLDYTVMYIVSNASGAPFNYYLFLSDQRDVYLYDYNKYLSEEPIRRQVLKQLDAILKRMKKEMKIVD